MFHGSVLFDVDLDVMDRLLAPGKRKYCGTAMRSVFARVRNAAPPGVRGRRFPS